MCDHLGSFAMIWVWDHLCALYNCDKKTSGCSEAPPRHCTTRPALRPLHPHPQPQGLHQNWKRKENHTWCALYNCKISGKNGCSEAPPRHCTTRPALRPLHPHPQPQGLHQNWKRTENHTLTRPTKNKRSTRIHKKERRPNECMFTSIYKVLAPFRK